MMKKIILIAVTLMVCLTMNGLAENEPMEWVQTGDFWYIMSDEFYFQIPVEWKEQTANEAGAIVFAANSADHETSIQIEKNKTECKNNKELKKTIDPKYVIQEKKVNGIEADATVLLYVDEERKMEAYAFICRPKYRITVKAKVLFLNLCYITCVFSWIIC